MTLKSTGLADFTAQIISVVTTGNSLKNYYDRNPSRIALVYSGVLAPHALTQRFTYTVPANRKALVMSMVAKLSIVTVATTRELTQGYYQLGSVYPALAQLYSNAVGDRDTVALAQGIMLLAGDTLVGNTSDASTGGTVDYELDSVLVEFDA